MESRREGQRRVGVAIVGLGGAVATTAVAGIELLRLGGVGLEGLPLASAPLELTSQLAAYEELVFCGWDLSPDDLLRAAQIHDVLSPTQLEPAAPALRRIVPWPAVGNAAFCHNIVGSHLLAAESHRAVVDVVQGDLRRFHQEQRLDSTVVINLASTEGRGDPSLPIFATIEAFETALDADAPEIGPAMLYAYAALSAGVPYANFTPSVAAEVPALVALAERRGVPIAGKDGKTGQTMIKTALAPAFRTRALRVDGWYSANILGNRDGLALDDDDALASKRVTKGSVLDQILGYPVEDHIVDIRYYRPRGDNKESWDNIDLTGFLGRPMQLKINFLCRDSILAAPLVIELARLLDLANRRGERGVQEQLGLFFKLPMTARPGDVPEHALHAQERRLFEWLETAHPDETGRRLGESGGT